MSALSANSFSAKKLEAKLFATFVGATPTVDEYVITFDVYAENLPLRQATALLLPTGLPGFSTVVLESLSPRLSFPVVTGNSTHTFNLSKSAYQAFLNKEYYIVVKAGNLAASTIAFVLNPPAAQPCDCAASVGKIFARVHSASGWGPNFKGTPKLLADSASVWPDLIASGQATEDEKLILRVVAGNEGNFDTVHTSDNQVLTMGILQKTLRPSDDEGELARQLYEFQQQEPALFDCYLGKCGWSLKYVKASPFTCTVTYTDTTGSYTQSALRTKIREATDPLGASEEGHKNTILAPFVLLGNLPEFQDKQVRDGIARLHEALGKSLKGAAYKGFVVGDYLTTIYGKAVALDHSINRRGLPGRYVGMAMDKLIEENHNVSPDPTKWGSNRAAYEHRLIEIYGPLRDVSTGKGTAMTNGKKRYNDIISGFASKKHYFNAQ